MTDKQQRFCDEYMANGGNAYQAALSAGYAESTANEASKWVTDTVKNREDRLFKPELAEYIAEHSGEMERHNSKIATAEELQEFVSQVIRGEITDTVVSASGKVIQANAGLKDKLKAVDLLAKMKGMYTTRIDADIREVVIVEDF